MKKVSVAFGGGAVLGAAHVGVLKALLESDCEIAAVSGTSIGSMVAALYAFGHDLQEVEELAIALKWKDISSLSISKFGLMNNDGLGDWVKEHIGEVNIGDAKIPLYIVATDITSGNKFVFEEGSLSKAIQASTCIPGLFRPVNVDGSLLVDGGIVENVPLSPLGRFKENKLVAVDLNANHQYGRPTNIIDVLVNSFHFTLSSHSSSEVSHVDLRIAPDLSGYNRYDPKQTKALIKEGYDAAMKALKNF